MGKSKNRRKRLHEQISDTHLVEPKEKASKVRFRAEEDKYVDEKLSKKILSQARKQEEDIENETEDGSGARPKAGKKVTAQKVNLGGASEGDSDSEEEMTSQHIFDNFAALEKDVQEITEEDEEDLKKFMNPVPKERRTLADVILEKLAEKKTAMTEVMSDAPVDTEIDETVREHYIKIGEVLSHYRSGKLPKGFKAMPSFPNWQQLADLTRPEKWTAASVYAGTRIFVSNLPKFHFKDFCSLILLPRVRDDIAEYKRLNFHLFQALNKSVYKPGDFYEGIILPLCEAGDCTLREATIVAGVLAQNSIPLGYSAAALILISQMEYTGVNSIFMRVILNKKYSLPLSAVNAVTEHFVRFKSVEEKMPVLWHQCLLTLVQRYKYDLTKEQQGQLLKLITIHEHREMTPEIRREIIQSRLQPTDTERDMDL